MDSRREPLSAAERQRNYRWRQRQSRGPTLTNAERQQRYRDRQRSRTEDSTSVSIRRYSGISDNWTSASRHFEKAFRQNEFGHACGICDRLWFKNDLSKVKDQHIAILESVFGASSQALMTCKNCLRSLNQSRLPTMCTINGFSYPPKPTGLPLLNPISTRLVSPRIPFMSIRRLRRDGQYGIIGQVINIPIDVDSTINQLPRHLDDDHAFNVSIKRKLIHRSSYLEGYVKKRDIKLWLEFLIQQPLYRHLNITIDWPSLEESGERENGLIEEIDEATRDGETLTARQQTLLWNEENILDIAPGRSSRPLNLIFDHFAEELSFPQIYFGVGRSFNPNLPITPYMIANSEIRRSDRRGVTPEHILYMAMKILRMRVVDSIFSTFRCVQDTENINRRMIEDRNFLNECVEKNLSFLKSIPNSAYYWMTRKKDLFAMMRQLGKPTVFLTLSANEVQWPDLLSLLHRLNDYYKDINVIDPIQDLDRSKRSHLVNEDPATCCLYFHKLVDTIINMLQSKKNYNPFGRYKVMEYFMRIEFQHRGSPHAHILLWLENDPKEEVSETMTSTIQLVTDLCSVSQSDIPELMYSNQVHKHTFTCTKRGEETCRFNIPYWPMMETRVLLPLAKDDRRRPGLTQRMKKVKENLSIRSYDSIEFFLRDNHLNDASYLDMIRSSLSRPTLFFKRDMSQIMTNTFNPWIASVLNSNMDLQFILDEYSCASYVVDYINKSNRGTGNLHRELIKLSQTHPEMTYDKLLRKLGSRILNTVEMSAQEAAWYLLRQPMSKCSRDVVYIPTCWPAERQKSYKKRSQLDRENISSESTDIWTKNLIQKYEERPESLIDCCLADFSATYTPKSRSDCDARDETELSENMNYNQREFKRIIRYRNYDSSDTNNFKRELVTLYLPFKNEQVDILDRNRFISLYEENIERISAKMREYNSGCNMDEIIEELRDMCNIPEGAHVIDEDRTIAMESRQNLVREVLGPDGEENFEDFEIDGGANNSLSAIRRRTGLMDKEVYCSMMRTTNERQRELILEVIHRLCVTNEPPVQIFFTGPAGCGKTYVLKLIMETINRYSQGRNELNNAYVACASTGKAAVNLGGTTVHSAFHITQSRRSGSIARETLQQYRQIFANVAYVIIDEVSMLGNDVLHKVNQRLQEITGKLDEVFGGMNMIFCGDFRQLPPVLATPVYKGSRNHLQGALLWQSLDYYPLTQVMRQSDIVFSSILTKIGDGTPLLEDEMQLIHSRFRNEDWCDQNLKDVVRLFHQNYRVDAYNKKIIQGGFEQVAKDHVTGYSNNDQLVSARSKLHRMSTMETAGMPYNLSLAVGHPYMLTSNVDIKDGLVNGSLGILRFIENVVMTENDDQQISRLWLEFEPDTVGFEARMKNRPSVVNSRGAILPHWTPISKKSASIPLGAQIRCKRIQFPLSAACAITIHKSQGGTFERAVVEYDKSQQNQLVYVALSRVTSIEGLFLTNTQMDNRFHHALGSTAPSIREIKDEYTRLSQHPLNTLANKIERFINPSRENSLDIIICTINAQSLVAHAEDIVTDRILMKSHIIVFTETWMTETDPVSVEGYEIVCSSNHSSNSRAGVSYDSEHTQIRRTAGGVAIYARTSCRYHCELLQTIESSMRRSQRNERIDDVTLANVFLNGQTIFIIAAIYIHPRRSKADTESFLHHALDEFIERGFSASETNESPALLVTGDFNNDINDDTWLAEFMNREFGLKYISNPYPTTLGNTTIDLTFVRELNVSCISYVSYFSYHRPLFSRVTFND